MSLGIQFCGKEAIFGTLVLDHPETQKLILQMLRLHS